MCWTAPSRLDHSVLMTGSLLPSTKKIKSWDCSNGSKEWSTTKNSTSRGLSRVSSGNQRVHIDYTIDPQLNSASKSATCEEGSGVLNADSSFGEDFGVFLAAFLRAFGVCRFATNPPNCVPSPQFLGLKRNSWVTCFAYFAPSSQRHPSLSGKHPDSRACSSFTRVDPRVSHVKHVHLPRSRIVKLNPTQRLS